MPANLNQLLTDHGPALIFYARTWCATHQEAEDVVQEACLRALRQAHIEKPLALMYICVRSCALDSLKQRQRYRKHLAQITHQQDYCFEDRFENDETRRCLEQALHALPTELREVVCLRIWSEQSFESIAEITQVSAEGVRYRFQQALQRLRHHLERSHANE